MKKNDPELLKLKESVARTIKEPSDPLAQAFEEFFNDPASRPRLVKIGDVYGGFKNTKYAKYKKTVWQFFIDILEIPDEEIRKGAGQVFSMHMPPKEFAYQLEKYFSATDPKLRAVSISAAINSLPTTDKKLIPAIAALLTDPDPAVRSRAVSALGHFRAKSYVAQIIDLLADDAVRDRVELTLRDMDEWGKGHVKPFLPKLRSYLASDNEAISQQALTILSFYSNIDTDIAELLKSSDQRARLKAMELLDILTNQPGRSSKPPSSLLAASKHADARVKEKAQALLKERFKEKSK